MISLTPDEETAPESELSVENRVVDECDLVMSWDQSEARTSWPVTCVYPSSLKEQSEEEVVPATLRYSDPRNFQLLAGCAKPIGETLEPQKSRDMFSKKKWIQEMLPARQNDRRTWLEAPLKPARYLAMDIRETPDAWLLNSPSLVYVQ